MLFRHQLNFKKANCFMHSLKVSRSGTRVVSSGREYQVEIANYFPSLPPPKNNSIDPRLGIIADMLTFFLLVSFQFLAMS